MKMVLWELLGCVGKGMENTSLQNCMLFSWPYVVFHGRMGVENVVSDAFLGSWFLTAAQSKQENKHSRQQMWMVIFQRTFIVNSFVSSM